MTTTSLPIATVVAASLLVGACGGAKAPPSAPSADPTAKLASAPSVSSQLPPRGAAEASDAVAVVAPPSTCSLRGTATPRRDARLYDERGQVVALLSGSPVALSLSGFPSAATGHMRVITNEGGGGVQISATMAPTDLALFAAAEIPVSGRNIRIAPATPVTFAAADATSFLVVKSPSGPFEQEFVGRGTCASVSLVRPVPSATELHPQGLRGYVLRQSSLALFDKAGASAPFTSLTRAAGGQGVMLYSRESTDGWLHIEYRGDILVDAWVRAGDVEPLPEGEIVDQPEARTASTRDAARLQVNGSPRLMRTTMALPLRISANPSAPTVGTIAESTELYVLDVVVGWASVLPTDLTIVPPENKSFWVAADTVGM